MRITCCVMTDKQLTWERQVGSGAELPAYLWCVLSQTFPRKQKELSVLLVAQRKTFMMEFDSSCVAMILLRKDWDVHEGHCNTNRDSALISCCLHSVAYLQLEKRAWIWASCKWCALVLYLLPQSSCSWRLCSIPSSNSSQFRPKRIAGQLQSYERGRSSVSSTVVKCNWSYFFPMNEM